MLELFSRRQSFGEAKPFIGMTKGAERSGMRAYDEIYTYEVGKPTWSYSTIWYAGTIAYDGYHCSEVDW